MNNSFKEDEKLYRAVYPPDHSDMYWKKDGTVSTAAFADKNGLSVERGNYRPDKDVVNDMLQRFTGRIISVTAGQCDEVEAKVLYLPSKSNVYHSEIHGSDKEKLLNKRQRRWLASKSIIESY